MIVILSPTYQEVFPRPVTLQAPLGGAAFTSQGGRGHQHVHEEVEPLVYHQCICSYFDNCISIKQISLETLCVLLFAF